MVDGRGMLPQGSTRMFSGRTWRGRRDRDQDVKMDWIIERIMDTLVQPDK